LSNAKIHRCTKISKCETNQHTKYGQASHLIPLPEQIIAPALTNKHVFHIMKFVYRRNGCALFKEQRTSFVFFFVELQASKHVLMSHGVIFSLAQYSVDSTTLVLNPCGNPWARDRWLVIVAFEFVLSAP
jgi:hypothetical protein